MPNLEVMKTAVRVAGEYMLGAVNDSASTNKSNTKDFVTVADIKSQDLLTEKLTESFPQITVLSEEHSDKERAYMYEPDFTGFVLDPIDGTYNFKRDMRESAISVGYIKEGVPLMGVVFDPYKDELFEAEKGKGARRNGEEIHVSTQRLLEGSSIATSNSYDDAAMARNLRRHLAIYEKTGCMPWTSCPGSGVLIMVAIACGRIDAYHHNGIKPWDNAAAFLIIEEAGGNLLTLSGETAKFTDSAILVGNREITNQLVEVFRQLPKELLT